MTRTPGPTKTPAPKIEWASRFVDVALTPGQATQRTITFRVTQPLGNVTVRAAAPSGEMTVAALPANLEPGQDYQLQINLMLPAERRKWPLHGTITIRTGQHSIGPIVVVRGSGPRDAGPTAVPAATHTPRAAGTPRATRTPAAQPARINWVPTSLHKTLAAGASSTETVRFTATKSLAAPHIKVYTRNGEISLDPSSVPTTIEAGQTYELRIELWMPSTRPGPAVATLLIRDGNRSMPSALMIRVSPAR